MQGLEDHERAVLLVLPRGVHAAEAFDALLAHPHVRAWHFPPPWFLDAAGIDVLHGRPGLRTVQRENLREALDAFLALADEATLIALASRAWQDVPEPVRSFYLRRSTGGILASLVRLAPRTRDVPPPAEFVQAQIFLHRFELQYRLAPLEGEPRSPVAPAEEGSLVLYPFDPSNREARREARLPEEGGVVLEAFAYAPARDRHHAVLEQVARARGWQVVTGVG